MNKEEDKNISQKKFISLLRNRNAGAMEMMYDQFAPILYGVVSAIVKNQTDAEEILKQTFIHIWKNNSDFDESKQDLSAWLINVARGFAHAKVSFSYFTQNQNSNSFVVRGENGSAKFEQNKKSLMNAEEAEVLNLIFFGGGKINEVAKYLGKDESKVRELLREAVNHYRKQSVLV